MTWYVCRACVPDEVYEASLDTDHIVQCEYHIHEDVQPDMLPVSGRCILSSGLVADWSYGGD